MSACTCATDAINCPELVYLCPCCDECDGEGCCKGCKQRIKELKADVETFVVQQAGEDY